MRLNFNVDELDKAKEQNELYADACQVTCYVVRTAEGLALRNKKPFKMATVVYRSTRRRGEPNRKLREFTNMTVSKRMLEVQARARAFHELPSRDDQKKK